MKAAPKQNTNAAKQTTETRQSSWQNQSAQVANNSLHAVTQRALIADINHSPRMTAQRQQIESYIGAGQPPIQRLEQPEIQEQQILPGRSAQLQASPPKPNNTGLPDPLKSGIEALSGLSMDNVNVHYNSSQPAQLNALAYAQGTDIHIAPGQEQHLPHEAWHVVQQAQGRVKPTMQMKGGVPVNDDQGLEREADVMGGRAVQRMDGTKQKYSFQSVPPVFQLKQSHANAIFNKLRPRDRASRANVENYIKDEKNPKKDRNELLKAWNKGQKGTHVIKPPLDLIPDKAEMATMDNLEDWDSDEENDLDIKTTLEKKRKSTYSLKRGDGKTIAGVPLLENSDAIRLGRQVVKRDEYYHLPFIVQIGPRFIEYNNPGTKDIYGTPLIKEDDGTFKRAGKSEDYNFANLTANLEKEDKEGIEPELNKKQKLETIFNSFSGISTGKISEEQSEAIGAISCDFMKGSGAMKFVQEAIKKTEPGVPKIAPFFTGMSPHYQPAKSGGRKLVTESTPEYKAQRDAATLLFVNNCLINAIALVALGRNANLTELVAIRSRTGNLGEMLFASERILRIITEELNLNRGIIVRYPVIAPDTFGDTLINPIRVCNNGALHFIPD